MKMITEADTCRKYVLPKLYKAGWNDDQITEQRYFTDGRIVIIGKKVDTLTDVKNIPGQFDIFEVIARA